MNWSWVLFGAAAALLVVAGLPRALRPQPTVAALEDLGLRGVPPVLARLLGVAEALLGLLALLLGGALLSGAVGAAYLGFAVVTALGLRRGATSCGCFVGDDSAPTPLHVVVDLVLALAAAVAAASGAPGLLDLTLDVAAVPLLGAVVLDAGVAYLLLARLPGQRRAA